MVKAGQYVQVHYIGTLDDGTVFDNSQGREPLEFQVGSQHVIAGFDSAVMGMAINEEKKFRLTAEEAYGQPRDEMKREFPPSVLGEQKVSAGEELWFSSPHGPVPGKVVSVDDDKLVMDFNHPLAGKDLTFQIKVVGISDEPTQTSGCSCGCDCSTPPAGGCGSGCG